MFDTEAVNDRSTMKWKFGVHKPIIYSIYNRGHTKCIHILFNSDGSAAAVRWWVKSFVGSRYATAQNMFLELIFWLSSVTRFLLVSLSSSGLHKPDASHLDKDKTEYMVQKWSLMQAYHWQASCESTGAQPPQMPAATRVGPSAVLFDGFTAPSANVGRASCPDTSKDTILKDRITSQC